MGLLGTLSRVRWSSDAHADGFAPRAYLLADDDDKRAFITDFQLTAAEGLLKAAAAGLPLAPPLSTSPAIMSPVLIATRPLAHTDVHAANSQALGMSFGVGESLTNHDTRCRRQALAPTCALYCPRRKAALPCPSAHAQAPLR